MYRYLVVLIFYSLFIKSGCTLRCDSTNFNKDIHNVGNLNHTVKFCNESINEIRRLTGAPEGEIQESLWPELRCYTTVIAARNMEDIVFKGCVPKDGCSYLKVIFGNIVKHGYSTVDCRECEGDECNLSVKLSDPNGSVTIKGTFDVIFYLIVVFILIFKIY